MGTSMTISQKQKLRLHILNHAIPRREMQPELSKHYRYRVQHMKPRLSVDNQNEVKNIMFQIEDNDIQMIKNNVEVMPDQIPTLEKYTGVGKSSYNQSVQSEKLSSFSVVQTYIIKKDSKSQSKLQFGDPYEDIEQKINNQTDRLLKKSESQKIQNNSQQNENYQYNPSLHSSHISLYKKIKSSKKSLFTNKKQNQKKYSYSPNHVLQQIALRRQGQFYTVNSDQFIMMANDIKEKQADSQIQGEYLTQQIFENKNIGKYRRKNEADNQNGQQQRVVPVEQVVADLKVSSKHGHEKSIKNNQILENLQVKQPEWGSNIIDNKQNKSNIITHELLENQPQSIATVNVNVKLILSAKDKDPEKDSIPQFSEVFNLYYANQLTNNCEIHQGGIDGNGLLIKILPKTNSNSSNSNSASMSNNNNKKLLYF